MKAPEIAIFIEENKEEVTRTIDRLLPVLLKELKENGIQGLVEYAHGFTDAIHKHAGISSKISCGSSCSFCCYSDIVLTTFEAKYILGWIDYKDIKIDKELLARQQKKPWHKLKYADQKCIMLDDKGNCSIYEQRPMICRLWNSTSDPVNCDTRHSKPTRTARIIETWSIQLALLQMDMEEDFILLHNVLFKSL